jgi:hypothetical protein
VNALSDLDGNGTLKVDLKDSEELTTAPFAWLSKGFGCIAEDFKNVRIN